MVESISFSPFDAYRSGFYPQAAAISGSGLLTATYLVLEHYHCYSHIILNVAMTLFLFFISHLFFPPFFRFFFSMSLMSLNRQDPAHFDGFITLFILSYYITPILLAELRNVLLIIATGGCLFSYVHRKRDLGVILSLSVSIGIVLFKAIKLVR